MKTTWKIMVTAILASVMMNGIMTDFTFATLDIQLHDTYFVIDPVKAILFLTLGFMLIVGFYRLANLLTDRYRAMALMIAIINPLIALLLIIVLYNQVNLLLFAKELPAAREARMTPYWTAMLVVVAVLCFQVAIEMRALRKVREFWRG